MRGPMRITRAKVNIGQRAEIPYFNLQRAFHSFVRMSFEKIYEVCVLLSCSKGDLLIRQSLPSLPTGGYALIFNLSRITDFKEKYITG